MRALTNAVTRIYKGYLIAAATRGIRRFAERDFPRIVRRQMRNLQSNKKHMLRRAGLTTYSPMRNTVGGGLLFIGGAAAGALLGLSLAPMRGEDLVSRMRGRAQDMFGRGEWGSTQAPAHA